MSSDHLPPFPLPDLPRAPDSTISRVARRALEFRDLSALTVLPDALMDAGRDADARAVRAAVAPLFQVNGSGDLVYNAWADLRRAVLAVVFYDLYDWNGVCAHLAEQFAKPSGGTSLRGGAMTVGGVGVPIVEWGPPARDALAELDAAARTIPVTLTTLPDEADALTAIAAAYALHAAESHPDYEYYRTDGHNPLNGWEPNIHASRRLAEPLGASLSWMRRRTP